MSARPILFFDGQCPLCRKEIKHYQRIDHARRIDWQDLFDPHTDVSQHGITHEAAMKVIHAVSQDGQVLKGVAAFMLIWRELPGYRHLARIISTLHVETLLDRLYHAFARRRYRSRCRSGHCSLE